MTDERAAPVGSIGCETEDDRRDKKGRHVSLALSSHAKMRSALTLAEDESGDFSDSKAMAFLALRVSPSLTMYTRGV